MKIRVKSEEELLKLGLSKSQDCEFEIAGKKFDVIDNNSGYYMVMAEECAWKLLEEFVDIVEESEVYCEGKEFQGKGGYYFFPEEVWRELTCASHYSIYFWIREISKELRNRGLTLIDLVKRTSPILENGAAKYSPYSWMNVEHARHKYFGAYFKHKNVYEEEIDKESGLPHIDHALCNMTFLAYFEIKEKQNHNKIK